MQDKQGFFRDLYESFKAGAYYLKSKRAADRPFYNTLGLSGQIVTANFNDTARVDVQQNLKTNTEWVALLCDVNAYWVAQATDNYSIYNIINRDERKELDNHYAFSLLEDGNPDVTFFDMMYLMEYANQLIDGLPFYITPLTMRGEGGGIIPKSFTPLYPDMGMLITKRDDYGRTTGYEWQGGGKVMDIPEDQILWYRSPNIGNSLGGGGWVSKALRLANLDKQQKQHNLETVMSKGVPPGYVKFNEAMLETKFQESMAKFSRSFKSAARKGNLFGTDTNAEYTPLGFSAVELDMINGMNLTRDQLHQMAGVPRVMTGQPDANTMAEAKIQFALYKMNRVNKSLKSYNQFFTKMLNRYFPQKNGSKLSFEFDLSVPEDDLMKQQIREYKLRTGQARPNDFLIEDGKPPINPNDESDPMNKYYLTAGLTPIDEVSLNVFDITNNTANGDKSQDNANSNVNANVQDKTKKQAALSGDINVANTALNGAQITSLVEVITQVREGIIPVDSARNILKVSYPTLDDEEISSIMNPILDAGELPKPDAQTNNQ